MTGLRAVHGKNRWCGPAAVSAITGMSTDEASRIMRTVYGRRAITGASLDEVSHAIMSTGKRMFESVVVGRPTLARYLRERKGTMTTNTLLIMVTGHWVVVRGRKFVDSFTREPVFIRKAPGRRKRVKRVWVVKERKG